MQWQEQITLNLHAYSVVWSWRCLRKDKYDFPYAVMARVNWHSSLKFFHFHLKWIIQYKLEWDSNQKTQNKVGNEYPTKTYNLHLSQIIIKIKQSVHNIYLKHSDKLQFLLSPQYKSTKPRSHQEVLSLSQVCAYNTYKSSYFVLCTYRNKTKCKAITETNYKWTGPHPIHQKLKSKRSKKTTIDITRTPKNNGPKKLHTRHPQYTRR